MFNILGAISEYKDIYAPKTCIVLVLVELICIYMYIYDCPVVDLALCVD